MASQTARRVSRDLAQKALHGAKRRKDPPGSGLSTATGPEGTGGRAATQDTENSPRLRPDGSGEGGERDLSDLDDEEVMARNLRPEAPDKCSHH